MSPFDLPIFDAGMPGCMRQVDADGPRDLESPSEHNTPTEDEEEADDEAETLAAFQAYFRRCELTIERRRRNRAKGPKAA